MSKLKSGNQLDTVDDWIEYLSSIKAKYGGQTQVLKLPDDPLGGVGEPACHQLMIALNDESPVVTKFRLGSSCLYGGDPEDPNQLLRVRSNISLNADVAVLII